MAGKDVEKTEKINELAEAISNERNCDILIFNFGLDAGFEFVVYELLDKRTEKKKNLILILTTEGGNSDTAFRIARRLQDTYDDLTIIVAGWCKSAGTLFCIAASNLIIADCGELGPLDIQIAKYDELGERSSGLAVGAAFAKLQEESFRLFIAHLTDIKDKIGGRITFRTAADIAAQMVVGVTSGIFAKFDPLSIGEDHRANLVAEDYAVRLNLKSRNIKQDHRANGLKMLLRGYPSHGFVIDRCESKELFKNVSPPEGRVAELIKLLGMGVIMPRNADRNEVPRLEFLNENRSGEERTANAEGRHVREQPSPLEPPTGSVEDIRGHFPAGSGKGREPAA